MKKKSSYKYLVGIDEVGRGPIAGPVAVGAFVFLNNKSLPESKVFFRGVKESKQLTEEKREAWFKKIKEAQKKGLIDFHVSFQNEKVIDIKGISFAIKKCLASSLQKISKRNSLSPSETLVLLDGGLKAPAEYKNQKTIIKGDARESVIALASICAKVLRDRKMKEWGKKHPNYGFEVHKGYGTKGHYEAIKKHGFTALHRRSFCKGLDIDNKV